MKYVAIIETNSAKEEVILINAKDANEAWIKILHETPSTHVVKTMHEVTREIKK